MNTEEKKIDELLALYLAGEASEAECREIIAWINENKENKRYFEEFKDVYEAGLILKNDSGFDTEKSWQRVNAKYYERKAELLGQHNAKPAIKLYQRILRIAAVILIAIISGVITSKYFSKEPDKQIVYNEVTTPLGSKTSVVLADGTQVVLNAGSKLRYPVNFGVESRDVHLEGEAYFNVTKEEKRKFIVHTSHLNIKVLGTKFNVKAYPEEKTIETTLINGALTIEGGTGDSEESFEPVRLKPNQLAKFEKEDMNMEISSVVKKEKVEETPKPRELTEKLVILEQIDPVIYTSWKDPRWIIEGEELQSLAKKLERRYDVKITIDNESLKQYKFSGSLADETLEQVLDIIKITAPITYTIENKDVYFFENKRSKRSYDRMLIKK